MTTMFIQVTPSRSAAIYTAARILNDRGPMLREQLFAAMDFGPEATRERKLREAFDTNWLRETQWGYIALTEYSQRYFESQAPKEEYVGQITPTTYRANVFASPGLSKRYIPNRRGTRDDVPAWSVKPDGHSIKSIGGGGA